MRALNANDCLAHSKCAPGAAHTSRPLLLPRHNTLHQQPSVCYGWLPLTSRDVAPPAKHTHTASALPGRTPPAVLAASTLTREQQHRHSGREQGWGAQERGEEGVYTDIPRLSTDEDLEYLQQLQEELEGIAGLHEAGRSATDTQTQDASAPEASLTTGHKTKRASASGRSASPSAATLGSRSASRRSKPRRTASAPSMLSSDAASSTATLETASRLRASSLELPQPTRSLQHVERSRGSSRQGQAIDVDHVLRSGKGARQLLSRDEEGALALVARDGMHIEQGARQLAGILRREPAPDELARALKADPWELEQRTKASLAARRMLLQANYGLVKHTVMQYNAAQRDRGGNCLPFADSMEAGLQGLLRAIIKFNPEAGFKMSTYAMNWIKNELQRAQNQADLFRVPEAYAVSAAKLVRVRQQLIARLDREPSHEETRQELGWNERKYSQVYRAAKLKLVAAEATSLESSLDDESSHSLDAKMSYMLSKPTQEDGWQFSSSASAVTGSLERDEMLAKDLQSLLREVLEESQQQQQQQQQQQAGSSRGTAHHSKELSSEATNGRSVSSGAQKGRKSSSDSSAGVVTGDAVHVRDEQRQQPSSSRSSSAGDAQHSEGSDGVVGAGGDACAQGATKDALTKDTAAQLSPLHLEVLRLRLGLPGVRVPAAEARLRDMEARGLSGLRGRRLKPGSSSSSSSSSRKRGRLGRSRREEEPPVSDEVKWAQWVAARHAMEEHVLSGKPAPITTIAAAYRMTPASINRLEQEALQWLKEKKAPQVAQIMRGHDLEVDREAGMLPRSAGGATKKH